jgi:hypothetical protein
LALAGAPERPTESPHRPGSNGLEGWTLNYEVEGQGKLPTALVLARRGQIIRRIDGEPFVWKWIFLSDGKRVALEAGPLHFSMECVLVDIASGKEIEDYNCFSDPLSTDTPAWVKTLESVGKISFIDGDK